MPQPLDSKAESLRQQGVLNPHPQNVADPWFLRGEFFDPRDLVQVKYEMLRRVRVEGSSVTAVTQAFGFSRPIFYQAQALYHRAGGFILSERHHSEIQPREGTMRRLVVTFLVVFANSVPAAEPKARPVRPVRLARRDPRAGTV